MSTLELIQTQNEHKANTYYEKGEDTKITIREAFKRAQEEDPIPDALNLIYKKGD